ncbi:MAG: hypothetical protein A4S17_01225 [Proteobacteria bacterium HN_bin10]|nr:MAG: hypothetical protein A4S17_01225 [Proteobacteria bacterium HN_bin10]
MPDIAPPALTFPVKEQEVPVTLAIGPFDTSKVVWEGQPVSDNLHETLQTSVKETLGRTQIFKDIVILKLPEKTNDPEKILAAARESKADILMVGEVKEYSADAPWAFGTRFEVDIKVQARLYNVHSGAQVWKKTEKVKVAKDGSGFKKQESLDVITRYVAMPPIAAGILPPMVDYIQTDYLATLKSQTKGTAVAEGTEVFGGAEMAKVDAELTPPATATRPKDHAFAVVVGIEDYRDLPRVDYAKRDAESVKQYLIKAMGYREQNIVMILNDRVTKSQLEARFEKWLPKQVAQYSDAEVFVYYGGHGAPDPDTNQAYLVPYDGDPSFLETTAYPLKRLYDTLGKLPAKQVTVVMDSCFSGAGGRSVIAKGTRPMLIKVENPLMATQNIVVLSAAAGNEVSNAYPAKRHGLFTYYYLKGLQGEADADKDGDVEVEELYSYIKVQVEKDARRMQKEQTPQLLPGTDLLGDRAKQRLVEFKK